MILACPNGDLVDTKTGNIVGYSDFSPYVPLTKDGASLLRYFDGMSCEPLGTIPKIIAISRAEQRLLSRLRPRKWFKYAVNQDYLALVDKINHQRFSLFCSIRMTNEWADPNSVYRSAESLLRRSITMKIARANPNSGYHKLNYIKSLSDPVRNAKKAKSIKEARADPDSGYFNPYYIASLSDPIRNAKKSKTIQALWDDPNSAYNSPEFGLAVSKGIDRDKRAQRTREQWVLRKKKFGPSGCRYPGKISKKHSARGKERWIWRKLHQVMEMLFGGIVDEDAESFPCPHCNRVLRTQGALTGHIAREHPDKVPPKPIVIRDKSATLRALWNDPDSTYNSEEWKLALNKSMNAPSYKKNMRNVMREVYAWKKLSAVMEMLYGGAIVEKEMYICSHCGKAFPAKKGLMCHTTKMHLKLRDLDELELQSYQNMVWAYHTNNYRELTAGQKRTLKSLGLIKHKHGLKKGNVISLSRFGRDVLSSIDDTNTPLMRL